MAASQEDIEVVQEVEGEALSKEAAAQEGVNAVAVEGEMFSCMWVCTATQGEVSLQQEAVMQEVDALKEAKAQEGANAVPVEGEVSA